MKELLRNRLSQPGEPPRHSQSNKRNILQYWKKTRSALIAALVAAPGLAYAVDAEQIVGTTCAACHGADGMGTAPAYPNLAGQHRLYLRKQLQDFIDGRRVNEAMSPAVLALKPEEIDALASYFSSQNNAAPENANVTRLIEAGRLFYRKGNPENGVPGCTSCHMEDGTGDKSYPQLVGQNPAYIAKQLADFKTGTRTNDSYHLMRSVVTRMTDIEIRAVAEYLSVARTVEQTLSQLPLDQLPGAAPMNIGNAIENAAPENMIPVSLTASGSDAAPIPVAPAVAQQATSSDTPIAEQ